MNGQSKQKFHLALPVLDELENLPVFLDDLRKQENNRFELYVCVNHYEHWRSMNGKRKIIKNNEAALDLLSKCTDFPVHIIDRATKGNGWLEKKGGVGRARKTVMDVIAANAGDNDWIVSVDADTKYPENYLSAIEATVRTTPHIWGIALPYYHPLTGNEENDRLILRYEIYMRYYLLNMLRINNRYAFTALGSAMAFPVWAYRKVKGLSPVVSGEDFYFLQKLVKHGSISLWTETLAKPSARLSDRVAFGTGPALIKGAAGNWDSYPIYKHTLFDEVKRAFDTFPLLFENEVHTPMNDFLQNQFKTKSIWQPLRQNFKLSKPFTEACMQKVDGLRILQYLRYRHATVSGNDNQHLIDFLLAYYELKMDEGFRRHLYDFDFDGSAVCFLDQVRDFMFEEENKLRKQILHSP